MAHKTGGVEQMTGKDYTGDYLFDPEVMVMTLCTGLCAGMILVILRILTAQELMPVLFVMVTAGMVFVEGSWLNFWYRPLRQGTAVMVPAD
jgi:hypothetical protein